MRDPHKYDWLPPDPPRIPRQSVSNLQTAMTMLAGLAAIGAVAWLYLFWRSFARLVGWAFQ